MTVNEIISFIRSMLKEHDQDDSVYNNKTLWNNFLVAKAEVLANFRLRRFNFKNPQTIVGFCMELEEGLSHECGCITKGCSVLKTVKPLPEYLVGRNAPTLKISTLGGLEIDLIEETEKINVYDYHDMFKNKLLASLVNNYLIIWNAPKELIAIRVKANWADITQIEEVQYCNTEGTDECIDVFNQSIGIEMDLILECIRRMFKDIYNISLRLPEDQTNDSNSEIKQ